MRPGSARVHVPEIRAEGNTGAVPRVSGERVPEIRSEGNTGTVSRDSEGKRT